MDDSKFVSFNSEISQLRRGPCSFNEAIRGEWDGDDILMYIGHLGGYVHMKAVRTRARIRTHGDDEMLAYPRKLFIRGPAIVERAHEAHERLHTRFVDTCPLNDVSAGEHHARATLANSEAGESSEVRIAFLVHLYIYIDSRAVL